MGDTSHNTSSKPSSVKTLKNSRIPMFQRSGSLRLSGEKVRQSSLVVNGKQAVDLMRHNSIDERRTTKSQGLTRSTSFNEQLQHVNDNNRAKDNMFKYKMSVGGDQCVLHPLKIHVSEFESSMLSSPNADDACSVTSFRSCSSSMSLDAACSHAGGAAAVKKKKFVVHCPNHLEQEEYLTPTQRKDRQIRQLKAQLMKAKRELDEKEAEILLLTKEMINLRAGKSHNINSTAKDVDNKCPREVHLDDVFHSNVDSGLCDQFDDGRENGSNASPARDEAQMLENLLDLNTHKLRNSIGNVEEYYKKELEDVKRNHSNEYQEMKEKYNDRIETLLQKLSDANIKYFDLRPKYDRAQELVKQQEAQIARLEKEVEEQDKRHHQMYLKMYKKGQEAAKFEHADEVLEFAHQAPKRVAVPELLQQLKMTERELERVKSLYRRELYKTSDGIESEMTLRFLKDVIYHFLTNKDSRDHLRAIENIMGYSDSERLNIERSVFTRSKLVG